MSDTTIGKTHWSFWVIVIITLLWNIGGSLNYIMQMDAEFVLTMPETHQAIIQGRPWWATGGFAVGVFGGVLGCILLMLKKNVAIYIFVISLVGILVTMVHTVNVGLSVVSFTATEMFIMAFLPAIVAALLVWYAILVKRKGWIS